MTKQQAEDAAVGPRELVAAFPGLRRMAPQTLENLVTESATVRLPAGTRVVQPGDPCETCTLVVGGELRVHTESASGRALTLYSVVPGQMCALTSLSLVSGQPFPAHVDVVQDAPALIVPQGESPPCWAARRVGAPTRSGRPGSGSTNCSR